MHRSQTLRPLGKNVEYRITRHQNFKQVDGKMEPHGDPYPVVELFLRDDHDGELKPIDKYRMEQWVALAREVVSVGKELVPPKKGKGKKDATDGDEASLS